MNGFRLTLLLRKPWAPLCALLIGAATAFGQGYLYPDMFPYLDENAPAGMNTLQAWQLTGTTLKYATMFANQGDGLFEIRKGPDVSSTRYQMLQRVYIDVDFGSQYVDLPIGTAPKPGAAESPNPNDLNVIWFENFAKFSLLQAPVVDGVLTVGAEVASTVKTSWRVSSNTGPLPGFESAPVHSSSDQRVQQRVSVGWADMYSAGSAGQFIDISGIPIGPRYWLRQTVDPENRIHETDETNNSAEVLIDLAHPGEAVMFAGRFVQPGDAEPPIPGDLNQDGVVNRDDWLAFKAGEQTSLSGLSAPDAYFLGDLDFDGKHTLEDAILFRKQFELANGAGSFASLARVPEPGSRILASVGACAILIGAFRIRRRGLRRALLAFLATYLCAAAGQKALAHTTLYRETFDELDLGPNVDETVVNVNAWTKLPPTGWTRNDSGVPFAAGTTRGVEEWKGWSFADKDWWNNAAGDQDRSQFDFAQGTVAVADPDEWDDKGNPINGSPFAGYYNAFITTPPISLAGTDPGSAKLTFASSWKPECCDDGPAPQTNNQTATVRVSYNGGASFSPLMRWESNPTSASFKDDATNELVTLNLNNPAGAANVMIEFGLTNAGNDWWWAIDNVEVFSPTVLEVNRSTGAMSILEAADLTGYEITSNGSSLNPVGWRAGNLDAQNLGAAPALTADFDNDNAVDGKDVLTWQRGQGASPAAHVQGDADGNGAVDAADLASTLQQFGRSLAPGATWETLIADKKQLLEFDLLGSSSFQKMDIGAGYDTAVDARDLAFAYSSADGLNIPGVVRYIPSAGSVATPEPTGLTLVAGLSFSLMASHRRPARINWLAL